jgi:hypothetical protein
MMTRLSFALAVSLVAHASSACTSVRVLQTSGSSAPVAGIRDVAVVVENGAMPRDQEVAFRSYAMAGAIRSALIGELEDREKLSKDGVTLEFSPTSFRLRSGTTLALVGVMAGSDHLSGTISIKDGEQVLRTFDAGARGSDSFYSGLFTWRLSAGRRADRFCRLIARRVAEDL